MGSDLLLSSVKELTSIGLSPSMAILAIIAWIVGNKIISVAVDINRTIHGWQVELEKRFTVMETTQELLEEDIDRRLTRIEKHIEKRGFETWQERQERN